MYMCLFKLTPYKYVLSIYFVCIIDVSTNVRTYVRLGVCLGDQPFSLDPVTKVAFRHLLEILGCPFMGVLSDLSNMLGLQSHKTFLFVDPLDYVA